MTSTNVHHVLEVFGASSPILYVPLALGGTSVRLSPSHCWRGSSCELYGQRIEQHLDVSSPLTSVYRPNPRSERCSDRFSGSLSTRSCGSRAPVFEAPICPRPGLCTMPTGGQAVGDARVRINTATADELNESLSGVGSEQARLIVAYREEHGYLRGPEDLGQVEGIDRGTAAALAPYIDWSIPPEREATQQREWGWALVAAGTLLAFLWQLAFGSLPALVHAVQGSNPLDIWYAATNAGLQVGITLGMSALVAFFLTDNRRRARKAVLVGFAGLIAALLAYVSATLATASRYLFLDSGGWAELRRNPQELVSVPTSAAIALVALPVLRSGESPFFPLARYLTPERDTAQPAGAEAAWGTWLNSRLPDEVDQRALKRYLDQRY